jgi:SSS family solute:Na+ symporter
MWLWVKINPSALAIVALSPNAKAMSENMYRALWSWTIAALVTIGVSYFSKPKPESELVGLVRGCTELPSEGHLKIYQRPIFWAGVILVVFIALNIIFW